MKYNFIFALVFAVMAAGVCPVISSARSVPAHEPAHENDEHMRKTVSETMLVDGVEKYVQGDIANAEACFDKILKTDSGFDAAWYYKGLCRMQRKDGQTAEAALKRAVELDSANFWYRYVLAELYGMTGKRDLTVSIYESLLRDFPKRSELYYNLANLYLGQNQLDKALSTIHDIETQFGKSDATVMTTFNILHRQKRDEEAFRALEEYNREYSSPQVLTLLGDYQMSMYNDSTALAYYDEALSIDRDFSPAMIGKAEAYRLTRKYPQYFSVMEELAGDSEIPAAAKNEYLQAIIRQSDPRFVRSFTPQFDSVMDAAREAHPSDTAVMQTAGLYYYATGRAEQALASFRKIMSVSPESASAAAGYIQILLAMKDWKKAVAVSDSVSSRFPKVPDFIEYSNIAKANLEDWHGIVENCGRMLKMFPGDSAAALSAWSMMGDMYHQEGEYEKSCRAYDNALKINPDYAPVLNNYAYYLSVRGKNLKKAYRMSKKTVEAEPDNATYLDTFGWILFLQGKALEAKPFFKHAMMYGGKESATILEHYAQVLDSLGETDLARVYRQQAKNKKTEGKE